MNKILLCPERLRRIPNQFSWVDQRLAHLKLFPHAPAQAWLLYLFLLTVADAQGLSYYGERTLCQRLGLDGAQLTRARAALLRLELIAYRAPLYQVLALEPAAPAALGAPTPVLDRPTPANQARQHLRQLHRLLQPRSATHD